MSKLGFQRQKSQNGIVLAMKSDKHLALVHLGKLQNGIKAAEKKVDLLSNLQRQTDLGTLVVPFIHPPVTYISLMCV